MREWKIYIHYMLESIKDIEKATEGMERDEFVDNEIIREYVVRKIEIIGEVARNVPEDVKNKYPEIPWRRIIDTRNRIIHGYFSVDWDIVWSIVKKDLPELKENLVRMVDEKSD